MDKELGEEELYALARGVVGERCALLEAAFRTDPGGLLAYSEDPLARAMEKEAGKDVPALAGREHAGMLALASLEWLFKVCGRPWLAPDSTIPAETMVERCIRHVRGLLRYLNPSDAEAAYRLAERLDSMLHQPEHDAMARRIAQVVGRQNRRAEPQEPLHPPTEDVPPTAPLSRGPDASPAPHRERQEGTPPKAAAGSTSTTEQGSRALGAGARVGRRDLMAAAIEAAQRACSDPTDAVQVWLELRSMAERRVQPLRGTTEDGIQWVDSSDAPRTLKIGGLRDRIRRASTR